MYLFMKLSDFLRPSNSERFWMLKNIKYIIKTLLKTQDNKSLLGQDNIHNIKKKLNRSPKHSNHRGSS